VHRVRRLLHLLGIRQERLVECTFEAHEKEKLVRVLWKFVEEIEVLGPLMVKTSPKLEELRR